MSWGKICDRFHSHPKPEEAGLEAVGLWALALSYCCDHLSDGVIGKTRVVRLAGGDAAAARCTVRLVASGLWHRADAPCPSGHERCDRYRKTDVDGFRFHDWEDYEPTRDGAERERERKRKNLEAHRSRARETELKPVSSPVASAQTLDLTETGFTPQVSASTPAIGPSPSPIRSKSEPLVPCLPTEPTRAPGERIRTALASHEATAGLAAGSYANKLEGRRMSSGTTLEQVEAAIAAAAADALDGETTHATWQRVRVFCDAARKRAARATAGPAPAYTNNRVQHDPPGKQVFKTATPIKGARKGPVTPEDIKLAEKIL